MSLRFRKNCNTYAPHPEEEDSKPAAKRNQFAPLTEQEDDEQSTVDRMDTDDSDDHSRALIGSDDNLENDEHEFSTTTTIGIQTLRRIHRSTIKSSHGSQRQNQEIELRRRPHIFHRALRNAPIETKTQNHTIAKLGIPVFCAGNTHILPRPNGRIRPKHGHRPTPL